MASNIFPFPPHSLQLGKDLSLYGPYYKLITKKEQYKTGVNTDSNGWRQKLCFVHWSQLMYYNECSANIMYIREVTLSDQESVWIEERSMKAHCITLAKKKKFRFQDYLTEKLLLHIFQHGGHRTHLVPTELMLKTLDMKAAQQHDDILQMCMTRVRQDAWTLKYVPQALMTKELCEIAVQKYAATLEYVPPELITKELCLIAVQKDANTLKYVPRKFMTDEICTLSLQKEGYAISFIPDELVTVKLCKTAIQEKAWALCFVPQRFKTIEICTMAVQQNGWTLQYVPTELKTKQICKVAIQQNETALEFVPPELRVEVL